MSVPNMMKKTNLLRPMLLSSVLLVSNVASAQVVSVQEPTPTLRFNAPPPLVVIHPGVQVVEDQPEEVFFVDGWYWMYWNDNWYRSRDHLGGWAFAPRHVVPVYLISLPHGQYKNYKRPHKKTADKGADDKGKDENAKDDKGGDKKSKKNAKKSAAHAKAKSKGKDKSKEEAKVEDAL